MLTKRAKDTLTYIKRYMSEHDEAPTMEEITKGIGISSIGSAYTYVDQLVKAGKLKRLNNRTRGLQLIEEEEAGSLVFPVLGKIAAGQLNEAVADESEIDVSHLFSGSDRYVLKVKGESMTGKGIMPGDYVIIDSSRQAKDGDIIVALVSDDVTLKTIINNRDGSVTLMPANDSFEPTIIEADSLDIQGVVVGQMRTYS